MKKILLIGNYIDIEWHPLTGVDNEIRRILDGYDITITEEYPSLKLEDVQGYDLIVNYADTLNSKANPDFTGALLGYVSGGGSLLTLHNGIIAYSFPELEQLIGAKFTGHPPQEVLEYVKAEAHPITETLEPFSIDEEPYMFEPDNLAKVTMIMEFIYNGEKYPAAWVRTFGRGRACYLQPGHNQATFTNERFCNLLRRAALWCTSEL